MRLPSGVRKRGGSLEKRFTVNGKQYSVNAKSITELIEKEVKKRADIKSGLYAENNKVTLDAYYEEWITEKEKSVKKSTIEAYAGIYINHISPLLGQNIIKKIEVRHIKNMLAALQDKGLSAYNCNRCLLVVSMILKSAIYDRVISENPAQYVKRLRDDNRPKAAETIHRGLTETEQEAFMKAARENYYYEFFAFLLLTGMRFGEATALTWGDIDKFNNVIHINKTIAHIKGGYTVQSPKTKTSKRDIPLTESIENILKQAREKAIVVNGTEKLAVDDRVFTTPYKNLIVSFTIRWTIKSILKKLEAQGQHIEWFTVHALRDTFATRFIEQGGNPQTLKSLLGHTNLAMTMDLYSHVLPNTKQAEMENMRMII